jgi:hypothetical protein
MIQRAPIPIASVCLAILAVGSLLGALFAPAAGQSLEAFLRTPPGKHKVHGGAAAVPDTLVRPRASARTVVAEVALASALAAAAGYGVGLLAEELSCDECDASEPGGDVPGLLIGVPAGATLGVWLVGRRDPPSGRLGDTILAAFAGSAVFAGFASLIENQPDAVRWSGVVLAGGITAMGWNRSRPRVPPSSRPPQPRSSLAPTVGAHGEIGVSLRF